MNISIKDHSIESISTQLEALLDIVHLLYGIKFLWIKCAVNQNGRNINGEINNLKGDFNHLNKMTRSKGCGFTFQHYD